MDDLDARLAALESTKDGAALVALGDDLSDAGRFVDAEQCFRRAVELGNDLARFQLGNAVYDQGRYGEAAGLFRSAIAAGDTSAWHNLGNSLVRSGDPQAAVAAFKTAAAGGENDSWLSLGQVLEDLGDLAGAIRAYRAGSAAGDAGATISLAFMLRDQDDQIAAEHTAQLAATQGSSYGAAVLACWRWDRTQDPDLETALRAGARHYPSTRAALAALLTATGRVPEARAVLEHGAKLGEAESMLPLGNHYADELHDLSAAEEAYRAGIAAGDAYAHHNLALLLEQRGDLTNALNHYRLAAAAGDPLAIQALHRLDDRN